MITHTTDVSVSVNYCLLWTAKTLVSFIYKRSLLPTFIGYLYPDSSTSCLVRALVPYHSHLLLFYFVIVVIIIIINYYYTPTFTMVVHHVVVSLSEGVLGNKHVIYEIAEMYKSVEQHRIEQTYHDSYNTYGM